jgi:hypothetical protein
MLYWDVFVLQMQLLGAGLKRLRSAPRNGPFRNFALHPRVDGVMGCR